MKLSLSFFYVSALIFFGALGLFIGLLEYPLTYPSFAFLDSEKEGSQLLDDEGTLLYRFKKEHRAWVHFNQIPPSLLNAFIAAEDRSFFSHHGISIRGIIRSCYINLIKRKLAQGASTITQQVTRLLFLNHQRSFLRKIKEVFIALYLERHFSKEQIFELYVNTIYFGRGIYGISAAADRLWGKTIEQLTIAESATLAGVAKSARFYSPLNDLDRSLHRRNIIIQLMKEQGRIAPHEAELAHETPLVINQLSIEKHGLARYYQEWIRQWAEQEFGPEMLYNQQLTIHSTLNKSIQEKTEKIFIEKMTTLRNELDPLLNGGALVLEGSSGAIKATIGGYDFKESQFNRSFQAVRQLGSAFKPFLFTSALLHGISLSTTEIDEPYFYQLPNKKIWNPQNWNNKHAGEMTLARALIRSNNIIAAKLLEKIGYSELLSLAKNAGLHRQMHPVPALALGITEATVQEAAAAFNFFAHDGFYVKPHLILCIKDAQGKTIWENKPEKKRIVSSLINGQICSLLKEQIHYLNKRLHMPTSTTEMIGKTGSTNNAKTMWFVGATPSFTTAVYVGRDNNTKGDHTKLASSTAYPIWRSINDSLDQHEKRFYLDPSLQSITIDAFTGERLDKSETNKKRESLTFLTSEIE
jgi:penicillin-binding protein 1A